MRVVTVGMGPIGHAIAELAEGAEDLELLGTVDSVPGRTRAGVPSMTSVDELDALDPEVALVATGSRIEGCADTFDALLGRGIHVVSTCEELTFPFHAQPELSAKLDRRAGESGAVLLGCGVNPGFLMDALPSMLASASLDPTGIVVRRRCDLDRRRSALSAKVGAGLTVEEWHVRHEEAGFGHVGLVESALLCCAGQGWTPRSVRFERSPRERDGLVTGICELATVDCEGGSQVELELSFERGGEELDLIRIEGNPAIQVEAPHGVHGDLATAARALHSVRCVGRLSPGLRLPLEVPAGRVPADIGDFRITPPEAIT